MLLLRLSLLLLLLLQRPSRFGANGGSPAALTAVFTALLLASSAMDGCHRASALTAVTRDEARLRRREAVSRLRGSAASLAA